MVQHDQLRCKHFHVIGTELRGLKSICKNKNIPNFKVTRPINRALKSLLYVRNIGDDMIF